MSNIRCQSCSMPIESGHYCAYCTDDKGRLQPFEERFDRMKQFWARQHPELGRAEVERQTLEYMSQMPAWKENATLRSRLSRS